MSIVDVDCHPCPSDGTDLLARPGYIRPAGSNPRWAVRVIIRDTGIILKVKRKGRSMVGYCAAHGVLNGRCAPDADETQTYSFVRWAT